MVSVEWAVTLPDGSMFKACNQLHTDGPENWTQLLITVKQLIHLKYV